MPFPCGIATARERGRPTPASSVRIVAIIQARMSSSRYPGKALYPVAGKPILQYVLDRLERCRALDGVIVATSSEASDDPLEEYCRRAGAPCRRGSLADVASRFAAVAAEGDWDAFLRVNGDSPYLDQALVGRAAELFRERRPDMVSNVHPSRSFPSGQSVEILDARVYREAYRRMSDSADLEHVTRFFHRNAGDYRIVAFAANGDWSGRHMAIDTPADQAAMAAVLAAMDRPHWTYGWREVLELLDRRAGGPEV